MSSAFAAIARDLADAWRSVSNDTLQFWHRDTARLALLGLLGATVVLVLLRFVLRSQPGRHYLLVPAILRFVPATRSAWVRHLPMALCVTAIPLVLLAVADPYSSLVTQTVTYPGRRISLMIDASDSMQTSFKAATLNTRAEVQPAFFTTVAAAERFVQLRRKSRNRDLMALVEFGNRAYVITPFTSDYDNLLLSMSLIGDPVEFSLFPESGTVIASALEESIEIFKAFNFLEAAGNLMVIFTDGEDTTSIVHGRPLDDILKSAVDNHIPLYFVRTNYGKNYGDGIPDAKWRAAVERTGGKYYVAKDEASLLSAVNDIDRVSVGAIETTQYANQQPRFSLFALLSMGLWTSAATLKLATPWFGKIPVEVTVRTIIIRSLVAVTLITAAWLCWREATLIDHAADARMRLTLLQFSSVPEAAPPWTLSDALWSDDQPMAAQSRRDVAIVNYWQGHYADVMDIGRQVLDPDLLLVAANASFRSSQREGLSSATAVTRLDGVLQSYASVLKAAPRHADAAYNYEYVARVRDAVARAAQSKSKVEAGSLPIPSAEQQPSDLPAGRTLHGQPGAPPPEVKAEDFKIIAPMEFGDREAQPEPTPGGKLPRKG